jgi:hypothetical protein
MDRNSVVRDKDWNRLLENHRDWIELFPENIYLLILYKNMYAYCVILYLLIFQ